MTNSVAMKATDSVTQYFDLYSLNKPNARASLQASLFF